MKLSFKNFKHGHWSQLPAMAVLVVALITGPPQSALTANSQSNLQTPQSVDSRSHIRQPGNRFGVDPVLSDAEIIQIVGRILTGSRSNVTKKLSDAEIKTALKNKNITQKIADAANAKKCHMAIMARHIKQAGTYGKSPQTEPDPQEPAAEDYGFGEIGQAQTGAAHRPHPNQKYYNPTPTDDRAFWADIQKKQQIQQQQANEFMQEMLPRALGDMANVVGQAVFKKEKQKPTKEDEFTKQLALRPTLPGKTTWTQGKGWHQKTGYEEETAVELLGVVAKDNDTRETDTYLTADPDKIQGIWEGEYRAGGMLIECPAPKGYIGKSTFYRYRVEIRAGNGGYIGRVLGPSKLEDCPDVIVNCPLGCRPNEICFQVHLDPEYEPATPWSTGKNASDLHGKGLPFIGEIGDWECSKNNNPSAPEKKPANFRYIIRNDSLSIDEWEKVLTRVEN